MINRVVRLYAWNGFAGADWQATLGTDWRATVRTATTNPTTVLANEASATKVSSVKVPAPAAQMSAAAARLRDVSRVWDVSELGASARRHHLVPAHASALPIPPRGIPPV
jgi:hypothetical protein